MKSLAEREAQRAKQRAAEAKERNSSPSDKTGGDKFGRGESRPGDSMSVEGSGTESSEPFDAKDWVNDNVDAIKSNLSGLTDAELVAVEQAEASGKKRASVADAIAQEKKKREGTGSNWGAGK